MHWIAAMPRIQLRYRHRVRWCRDQVVFRRNGSAIPGVRQNMEHQTDAEPAAAFLTGTADFERLAGDTYGTADLRAPRAGEVDHAAESGAKDIRGCNGFHNLCLVT